MRRLLRADGQTVTPRVISSWCYCQQHCQPQCPRARSRPWGSQPARCTWFRCFVSVPPLAPWAPPALLHLPAPAAAVLVSFHPFRRQTAPDPVGAALFPGRQFNDPPRAPTSAAVRLRVLYAFDMTALSLPTAMPWCRTSLPSSFRPAPRLHCHISGRGPSTGGDAPSFPPSAAALSAVAIPMILTTLTSALAVSCAGPA